MLWDDPAEQPDKREDRWQIANPQAMRVNSLLMEAEQLCGRTSLHDLADCATACKKLAEIRGKLIDMPGSKAKLAAEHVESEVKRIRLATVEAF